MPDPDAVRIDSNADPNYWNVYSNITDLEGDGKQEAVPRKTTFIFLAPVLGDCGHRITFSSTIGFYVYFDRRLKNEQININISDPNRSKKKERFTQ
jgi:hypothetical protein